MAWNLNNQTAEYSLHKNLSSEIIDIFGLTVTYVKTERANPDIIFGEHTHLRADNDSVFNVNVYPENTSGFENQNDLLSKFGLLSFDYVNLFISISSMSIIHTDLQFQKGVGDLIVLPSKKVFEITEIESQVQGMNNLFTTNNQKNLFLLKCKPYHYNNDEINISTSVAPDMPNLDTIFDIPLKNDEKVAQDTNSPVIKNIDPVFGDLG